MARHRDERGTRYFDDDQLDAERERRHRRRREREQDEQDAAAKRERRERRRADDARREAELDIDDLRAQRESYYSRPEADRRRARDQMAQEIRVERAKEAPRTTHRELRRDGTRRSKRRDAVADDRGDEYVYASRGAVEETTIRRGSTRKRSDEGGSSSRTAYTPVSGSGSASLRRGDASKLSRYYNHLSLWVIYTNTLQEHVRTRAKQGSHVHSTVDASHEYYEVATPDHENSVHTRCCAKEHRWHICQLLRKACAAHTCCCGAQGDSNVRSLAFL